MKIKKTTNRGRKQTDSILRFRTLIWYWGVRHQTGMLDGQLDLEFAPTDEMGHKRMYADRLRIFEEIRTSGCTITRGNHKKRGFDLLTLVDAKEGLQGSVDFYNASFWEYITEKNSTIESAIKQMVQMIHKLELHHIKMEVTLPASSEEIDFLSKKLKLSSEEISKILANDIPTHDRKKYDDLLQSFGMNVDYFLLSEKMDFELLTRYFDKLCFFVAFYKFSMLTGNYHALIAAADIIDEYLSLLFLEIKWIPQELMKELGHEVHNRIYYRAPKNSFDLTELVKNLTFDRKDTKLAINNLLRTLNQTS